MQLVKPTEKETLMTDQACQMFQVGVLLMGLGTAIAVPLGMLYCIWSDGRRAPINRKRGR